MNGLLVLISYCLIIVSCAPKSTTAVVLSHEAEDAALENYKTYAWLPPDTTYADLAIIAVEEQLEMRGYSLDTQNPDFLIGVHVIQADTDELVRPPLYNQYDPHGPDYYSGPFINHYYGERITVPIASGYDLESFNYAQSIVIIDIIDREKFEIVWRGWAEDEKINYLDLENYLPGHISQIFDKFPVSPDN